MKEISRVNDYFARYLFGKANNEPVLLNFINAVMKDSGFEPFDSVEVINPFNLKENYLSAETIVDVKAKNEKGETVIIEIQTSGGQKFIDRVVQYWAKNFTTIVEELKQEEKDSLKQITDEKSTYKKAEVKAVICIAIVDFKIKPETQSAHTTHMICCLEDNQITTDKLQLHFLELPKSIETLKEKDLCLWHKFFSSDNFEEEKTMLAEQNTQLKKAVNDYEVFRANKDYMSEYDKRQTFLVGQSMMLQGAVEEGRKEGIKEGIKEGNLQTAKMLKQLGDPISKITKVTGLSEEEIEKL